MKKLTKTETKINSLTKISLVLKQRNCKKTYKKFCFIRDQAIGGGLFCLSAFYSTKVCDSDRHTHCRCRRMHCTGCETTATVGLHTGQSLHTSPQSAYN